MARKWDSVRHSYLKKKKARCEMIVPNEKTVIVCTVGVAEEAIVSV